MDKGGERRGGLGWVVVEVDMGVAVGVREEGAGKEARIRPSFWAEPAVLHSLPRRRSVRARCRPTFLFMPLPYPVDFLPNQM